MSFDASNPICLYLFKSIYLPLKISKGFIIMGDFYAAIEIINLDSFFVNSYLLHTKIHNLNN